MSQKIVVPDIGENVDSGKVVAVHVHEGDRVAVDDTLIELETDKAVVEIPSTAAGQITEVVAAEGDELRVGDVIAEVDPQEQDTGEKKQDAGEEQEAPDPEERDAGKEQEPGKESPPVKEEAAPEARTAPAEAAQGQGAGEATEKAPPPREAAGGPVPASPGIRRLARELGADIHAVQGSGPGGRITEADVKTYVRKAMERVQATGSGTPAGGPGEPALPDFSRWGAVESVALETVRRLTAASTMNSWRNIPHVTQFDKADITNLEGFLKKNAGKVAEAGGKLTLTPVLTRVCAQALIRYPRFNASLDANNERLILKRYVHIGIAVDTARGLLVPVVRNADTRSITELAVTIADLAERARDKKVTAPEMEGGSFTISNQGGIGGVGFTPIIFWPQVAILGVSRAVTEPVAVEGQFQPRRMLPLALSYDHRVIDGADAARFLRWVCTCLEQPMTLLL